MPPLVSVLTPSYNQKAWLCHNLRSVAEQRYAAIEHVVMDGGSTDGSVDILRAAEPAVRWTSEPDRGIAHALNKAFAQSTGEIIGWLNSDDAYFDDQAVAVAVDYFERHPEIDMVYGHTALVNANGLILQMMWAPPFMKRLLSRLNYISQPSAFVRRSALGDQFLDERYLYCMDRELWLRLAQHHGIARINRVQAIDRHHNARWSLTRTDLVPADQARLAETYGTPQGRASRAIVFVRTVFRLFGIVLLGSARQPVVFNGGLDSGWRLAWRQVAVRRRAMPAEGGL